MGTWGKRFWRGAPVLTAASWFFGGHRGTCGLRCRGGDGGCCGGRKAGIRKSRLALRDSRPIVSLLTALLILSPDAQAAQFQPGFNAHDAAGAGNLDLFLLFLAGLPG